MGEKLVIRNIGAILSGRLEEPLFDGDCLRGQLDKVFLATKCGVERSPEGKLVSDNRPETIRESCDASLKRLGVERIDLFYLHRIDPRAKSV